jgi:hypothetical protein
MTDQSWLQSLKVGDEVAYEKRENDDRIYTGTVSRLTETHVIVAGKPDRSGVSRCMKFHKSYCHQFKGEAGTYYYRLIEPTVEVMEAAAEQYERERFYEKLFGTDFEELSLDQLRRIVLILDEGKET